MALVKLSNEILSVRGRFGGVYFKTGPDGQHIQAWPRTRNYVRSPAQVGAWGEGSPFASSGIQGFSGMAGIWMMALLAFFSAAWAAYALAFWFTTKTGERKRITGYNWYIHYALAFPECERPPFFEPPHSVWDLPNFLVTYRGMWPYEHSPLEWPADCCAGTYYEGLVWNGKQSYRTDNLKWFLWWDGANWILSPGLDFKDENNTFVSDGAEIVGWYWCAATGKYAHVYFGNPDEIGLPH